MAGGRPTERDEAKTAPVSMRTTPELRHKLEQAAERNDRSLAREMESRLERTFNEDDLWAGPHNNTFFRLILGTVGVIENRTGKRWPEDRDTFLSVRAAVNQLLASNAPNQMSIFDEIESARVAHATARQRLENARRALAEFRRELPKVPVSVGGPDDVHGIPVESNPFAPLIKGFVDLASNLPDPQKMTGDQKRTEGELITELQMLEVEADNAFAAYVAKLDEYAAISKGPEAKGRDEALSLFRVLAQ